MDTVTLTPELIHGASTAARGWTRQQLAILGVKWPPPKGWLKRLAGKVITRDQWAQFLAAGNSHAADPDPEPRP